MQVGGLGIYLGLSGPTDHDVANEGHPSAGPKDAMSAWPADRGIDPVPRFRGNEEVEAPTLVVPLLEGRRLDLDVLEAFHSLAGEGGHAFAGLHRGQREAEGG